MINATLTAAPPGATRYTVEHRDGCILIYGDVPASALGVLTQLAPKDSRMSPGIASLAGATFAFGAQDALYALSTKLAPGAVQRAQQQIRGLGLPAGAAEWLGAGERGISSETIFSHLTGFNALRDHRGDHPHDPSDWRRCELLLEAVPALRESFPRMRELGPVWSALVDRWSDIRASMDAERPGWRDPNTAWRASATYELMRSIIDTATKR